MPELPRQDALFHPHEVSAVGTEPRDRQIEFAIKSELFFSDAEGIGADFIAFGLVGAFYRFVYDIIRNFRNRIRYRICCERRRMSFLSLGNHKHRREFLLWLWGRIRMRRSRCMQNGKNLLENILRT